MARAKRTIARREAAKEAARGTDRTVATNRRARHEYEILDRIECGIVLQGSEVKSLREGTAQIADSYARVDDGELWLLATHIPPWKTGVGFSAHDPDRRRKLLVHRRQVDELLGRTRAQPLTLIPLPRGRSSTTAARTSPSATPSATWPAPYEVPSAEASDSSRTCEPCDEAARLSPPPRGRGEGSPEGLDDEATR